MQLEIIEDVSPDPASSLDGSKILLFSWLQSTNVISAILQNQRYYFK